MTDLLITAGQIYSTSEPFADAVLMSEGRVVWVGQSEAASISSSAKRIDFPGALVTPGFVDAHVHVTSAGLHMQSVDLRECRSKNDLLEALEKESRRSRGAPIVGHGWDQSQWSPSDLPTRAEIDRATFGSVVYLSRIDVHSALVSSALAALIPQLPTYPGWSEEGPVTAAAHGAIREAVMRHRSPQQTRQAQEVFIEACLKRGIVSIHECGGPQISGEADFLSLQTVAAELFIDLVAYWGEAGEMGIERGKHLHAHGIGGDLFVDGSIGSRTAWLAENYADEDSSGNSYLDVDAIHAHLLAATNEGLQAGFHAIGDQALAAVTEAVRRFDGDQKFRSLRHRVEHAELVTTKAMDVWKANGIVASVQPLFDAYWARGMYPARLGVDRARAMNRFATMMNHGVALAFGSDAPVTESSPWEWIRAAVWHSNPEERLTSRAAFTAATRGGRRAARQDDAGVIEVGARADIAVWSADQLVIQTPDPRVAAWSTDERSGTPGLPEIGQEGALPEALATIIGGRVVYQRDQ